MFLEFLFISIYKLYTPISNSFEISQCAMYNNILENPESSNCYGCQFMHSTALQRNYNQMSLVPKLDILCSYTRKLVEEQEKRLRSSTGHHSCLRCESNWATWKVWESDDPWIAITVVYLNCKVFWCCGSIQQGAVNSIFIFNLFTLFTFEIHSIHFPQRDPIVKFLTFLILH